jgi:hypothetical protein
MHTHRFGKKIKLPSTIAIKHQIRKLMWEDLVKETEVIARAELIRRSLSEETLHERAIKAVSAPSTDHILAPGDDGRGRHSWRRRTVLALG